MPVGLGSRVSCQVAASCIGRKGAAEDLAAASLKAEAALDAARLKAAAELEAAQSSSARALTEAHRERDALAAAAKRIAR